MDTQHGDNNQDPARATGHVTPALTAEERESYLKYILPTKGTPEEIAAVRARWTDDSIRMAMDMGM